MKTFDVAWRSDHAVRRTQRQRIIRGVQVLFVLGLVVGAAHVVLRTGIAQTQKITVHGATHTPADVIVSALGSGRRGVVMRLLGVDTIMAWPTELTPATRALLPGVTDLHITKKYLGRSLDIVVQERDALGIWCFERATPVGCAWFDRDGVAFLRAYPTEGSLVSTVSDTIHDQPGIDHHVLDAERFAQLRNIFDTLTAEHIAVRTIMLTSLETDEITVTTYHGPRLRMSLRFDAAQTRPAIEELKRTGAWDRATEVDLRIEHRTYYN